MKNIIGFILVLYAGDLFGQTDSNAVAVHKDPRIELLIKKQIQINEETTRDSRRSIPGYRIQILNSSDREKVYASKAKLYRLYPELKLYIIYQPPNYRLKAGNFKTSEDADLYLKKLSELFPTGLYVVHDIIEVKPEY